MISSNVVEQVGLRPVGASQVVGVSGEAFVTEKFRVRLDVPIDVPVKRPEGGIDVERTLRGMDALEVSRLPYTPENHDVLLGMDFVQGLHVTIHNEVFIISS